MLQNFSVRVMAPLTFLIGQPKRSHPMKLKAVPRPIWGRDGAMVAVYGISIVKA